MLGTLINKKWNESLTNLLELLFLTVLALPKASSSGLDCRMMSLTCWEETDAMSYVTGSLSSRYSTHFIPSLTGCYVHLWNFPLNTNMSENAQLQTDTQSLEDIIFPVSHVHVRHTWVLNLYSRQSYSHFRYCTQKLSGNYFFEFFYITKLSPVWKEKINT